MLYYRYTMLRVLYEKHYSMLFIPGLVDYFKMITLFSVKGHSLLNIQFR